MTRSTDRSPGQPKVPPEAAGVAVLALHNIAVHRVLAAPAGASATSAAPKPPTRSCGSHSPPRWPRSCCSAASCWRCSGNAGPRKPRCCGPRCCSAPGTCSPPSTTTRHPLRRPGRRHRQRTVAGGIGNHAVDHRSRGRVRVAAAAVPQRPRAGARPRGHQHLRLPRRTTADRPQPGNTSTARHPV
jgi:hypothetical protein